MRECQVGVVADHSAVVVRFACFKVDPTLRLEFAGVRAPELWAAVYGVRADQDLCTLWDWVV